MEWNVLPQCENRRRELLEYGPGRCGDVEAEREKLGFGGPDKLRIWRGGWWCAENKGVRRSLECSEAVLVAEVRKVGG